MKHFLPLSFDPARAARCCAVSALGALASIAFVGCESFSDGPVAPMHRYTSDDEEQWRPEIVNEAVNADDYYVAGELSFGVYGSAEVGNDQKRVEVTNKETRTETHFVTTTTLRDFIGTPGLTAVQETTEEKRFVSHTTHSFETRGPYSGESYGGGVDVEYFPYMWRDTWDVEEDTWDVMTGRRRMDTWDTWNTFRVMGAKPEPRFRTQVGFGLEGHLADGELFGRVSGKVILRFPIRGKAHVAPYVFAGIGGEFSDDSKLFGYVGGGLEKRFSPSFGVFTDARWVFDGGYENAAEFRLGVRFAFGPHAPTLAKK